MMSIARARNLLIRHGNASDESWNLQVPFLQLEKGRCYVLTGGNMSGKSTLLRCLASQHSRSHIGRAVEGEDWQLLVSPAVLSATDDPMFLEWSVADNIRVAAPARASANRSFQADLDTYLEGLNSRYGWRIRASDPLFECSRGAQAFIQLARAVLHRPVLYLVDEITANLDDEKAGHFIKSLVSLAETNGATVVLVSHVQRDRDYLADSEARGIFGGKLSLIEQPRGGTICRQDPEP